MDRRLTVEESQLLQLLLEYGEAGAAEEFLPDIPELIARECPCGCASLDFVIDGELVSGSGTTIISDYLWNSDAGAHNGIFVFTIDGTLAGMEVWSCDGVEIPGLPQLHQLRPIPDKTDQAGSHQA